MYSPRNGTVFLKKGALKSSTRKQFWRLRFANVQAFIALSLISAGADLHLKPLVSKPPKDPREYPVIFFPIHLPVLLILSGVALCTFGVAWLLEDFSIADISWGIYQIVIASSVWWSREHSISPPQQVLYFMVLMWAIRLSGFIAFRRSKKEGEDWRYAQMRQQWGGSAPLQALVKIFLGQALLAYMLSFSVIEGISRQQLVVHFPQIAGFILWALGLFWESVGDWQLFSFKSHSPKGAVMNKGLWSYSRHPNYTGELLVWWGIYMFSNSWEAILSPALISLLLLRISGVPLAEERYQDNADYQEYKRHTPAIIPKFLLPFWR